MKPDADKYLPWFILREIPGVGNQLYLRLLQAFGGPEQALSADPESLLRIPGMSRKTLTGITHIKPYIKSAEKELCQTMDRGISILTIRDECYPSLLKNISDPPPLLTFEGVWDKNVPCIAMVGSRAASSYGISTARRLAFKLAEKGFCIVSGMARGIDTAAHAGALHSTGKTIAVLGSGLKKIYPSENRRLFSKIQERGAVISEFKLDTDPFPYNFPVRNRIIAGLACGTLVVEAARRSGSLITARLAAEYNREVFAVPGSIVSQKSQGTHLLLKQGAKLVESEEDVVEELSHMVHAETDAASGQENEPVQTGFSDKMTPDRNRITQLLDAYPQHIDQIIEKSRMPSDAVSVILLELELMGMIKHHPGSYFSLT
ncbi:MAG: DNA-processing protein DprA [Desulfotignum sp.]|nr:DNA-processing protein DprA [Desulfotignum sp.]